MCGSSAVSGVVLRRGGGRGSLGVVGVDKAVVVKDGVVEVMSWQVNRLCNRNNLG